MYQRQLPLFPAIYRLELHFQPEPDQILPPVVWDSQLPRPQTQKLEYALLGEQDPKATLRLFYQLHTYHTEQKQEARQQQWLRWLSLGVVAAAVLTPTWLYYFIRRERARELRQLLAKHEIEHAQKLALENELRRQEAERKHAEMERKLLQQRVATQAAEQQALEIKSQLYASIGIMAGSYAHNIKNLLVRPNDLLCRCLEADGLPSPHRQMLEEVRGTMGTVTERLQQILRTVRRDPTRSEPTRLDLNALAMELRRHWEDMALQKWKLTLTTDLWPESLWIHGDPSHLMQAGENLLFNARDATFEMRNHLREQARRDPQLGPEERRHALIAAAAWKGAVVLRTRREDHQIVLEMEDNGIGMTEEVRRRCVETHFSTKRDNALYEGNTTGMGLGLSFVQAILEHHRARLEIISAPQQGATFRLAFPQASDPPPA
jgi:signal transduction histidine kinase